jgi:thiol-disulfide isomerase/thioredoxin
VEDRLADLRGRPRFDSTRARRSRSASASSQRAGLPVLGNAPELTGTGRWFNTPGGRPLSLAQLRGKVVLIDFWTYTCINCLRTLPYLRAWDARYRGRGLTVVGVHTPEFSFERDAGNVRQAVARNRLRYPVVQDNDYGTWEAFGNQYWPAKYLIDARGRVRYTHFGEGGYGETEAAIRALLREAGADRLGSRARAHAETADPGVQTPETYLGAEKADGFLPAAPEQGTHRYPGWGDLPASRFALRGTWRVSAEAATAVSGASLDAEFVARKVYLVMSSRGARPRKVELLLDGKPKGAVTVRGQRLYRLVSLGRAGEHRLTLRLSAGVSGYAFTFG